VIISYSQSSERSEANDTAYTLSYSSELNPSSSKWISPTQDTKLGPFEAEYINGI